MAEKYRFDERAFYRGDNFIIDTRFIGDFIMDSNSLQPATELDFNLCILGDTQHDGQLWTEEDVARARRKLVSEILRTVEIEANRLIDQSKPFGIHI